MLALKALGIAVPEIATLVHVSQALLASMQIELQNSGTGCE